jgi:hypothetical protein
LKQHIWPTDTPLFRGTCKPDLDPGSKRRRRTTVVEPKELLKKDPESISTFLRIGRRMAYKKRRVHDLFL